MQPTMTNRMQTQITLKCTDKDFPNHTHISEQKIDDFNYTIEHNMVYRVLGSKIVGKSGKETDLKTMYVCDNYCAIILSDYILVSEFNAPLLNFDQKRACIRALTEREGYIVSMPEGQYYPFAENYEYTYIPDKIDPEKETKTDPLNIEIQKSNIIGYGHIYDNESYRKIECSLEGHYEHDYYYFMKLREEMLHIFSRRNAQKVNKGSSLRPIASDVYNKNYSREAHILKQTVISALANSPHAPFMAPRDEEDKILPYAGVAFDDIQEQLMNILYKLYYGDKAKQI